MFQTPHFSVECNIWTILKYPEVRTFIRHTFTHIKYILNICNMHMYVHVRVNGVEIRAMVVTMAVVYHTTHNDP